MRASRTPPPAAPWRAPNWSGRPARDTSAGRTRRWLLRRRRLVASLLLCAAAALAVQQLTPASPVTRTVLVAARDLPAGAALSAADLVPAAVSPTMVPDGALAPESAADESAAYPGTASSWRGRQVSGPVRRGEVVTDASLLGDGLLVGAPPGSQAVPLRLADPTTVRLLHQGQLVTVVLGTGDGLDGPTASQVLATAVPVLWTPALAGASAGLLPSQETDGLVVVAAAPAAAVLLAGASVRGKVFLILVG